MRRASGAAAPSVACDRARDAAPACRTDRRHAATRRCDRRHRHRRARAGHRGSEARRLRAHARTASSRRSTTARLLRVRAGRDAVALPRRDQAHRRRTAGRLPRRRAAVRDLPRRISRQSRRDVPRASARRCSRFVDSSLGPRDLVVVMRPLDSLLDDPADARPRRRAPIDRRLRGAQRATTRRAMRTNATSSPATPARIEVARAQVTLSALNALAVHLGSLNDAARRSSCVSEGLAALHASRRTESLPTIDTIHRSANRANVSIYPIDPRDRSSDDPRDGDAACGACRADRRSGHWRRPRLRACDARRVGLERVLPARLPLGAQGRRPVPRDAGAREADRRPASARETATGRPRRTKACARSCSIAPNIAKPAVPLEPPRMSARSSGRGSACRAAPTARRA